MSLTDVLKCQESVQDQKVCRAANFKSTGSRQSVRHYFQSCIFRCCIVASP